MAHIKFPTNEIDWTHAKICITRFHVVTQQPYTPELHVYWMKSIWMFEKVPKGDIHVINYPEFYQIVQDYVGFSELYGIMRRRRNYAIPHPRIIPWGLHHVLPIILNKQKSATQHIPATSGPQVQCRSQRQTHQTWEAWTFPGSTSFAICRTKITATQMIEWSKGRQKTRHTSHTLSLGFKHQPK